MPRNKVLIVATSHGEMGSTGHRTGVWLEELRASIDKAWAPRQTIIA
jgi:hypothetical protein